MGLYGAPPNGLRSDRAPCRPANRSLGRGGGGGLNIGPFQTRYAQLLAATKLAPGLKNIAELSCTQHPVSKCTGVLEIAFSRSLLLCHGAAGHLMWITVPQAADN